MAILQSLGLSLVLTLLFEGAVSLILGLRNPRDLLLVGLVNILTNPLVVLTVNLTVFLTHSPPPWYLVAILEIAAVAAEGLFYRNRLEYRRIHPFLLSLILNAISFTGGLLL